MIDSASVGAAAQIVDTVDNIYALIVVIVLCAAGSFIFWVKSQKLHGSKDLNEGRSNGRTLVTSDQLKEHKKNCDEVLMVRFGTIKSEFDDGKKRIETIEVKIDSHYKEANEHHTEIVGMLASLGATKNQEKR